MKKTGYRIVCLMHNKKEYWYLVHRLDAIYFIDIPDELKEKGLTFNDLEVNHLNGTYEGKSINTVDNLMWVTSSENKFHAYKTGLKHQGEKSPISVYTESMIRLACELLEENKLGVREIEKITKVPYSTLAMLLSNTQWKSITKDYDFSKRKKQRHLYPKEVIDNAIKILTDKYSGKNDFTFAEIGRKVGMTRSSV